MLNFKKKQMVCYKILQEIWEDNLILKYITKYYQCLFLNNGIIVHLLFLPFYSLQIFENKNILTL